MKIPIIIFLIICLVLGCENIYSNDKFVTVNKGTVETGSMTKPQWLHTATLLKNGKVLIVGDGAELYDPKFERFENIINRTKKRYKHEAVLLQNGKVLICGGYSNYRYRIYDYSVELYDPEKNHFFEIGNIQREKFSITLLKNGKLLITGGLSPDKKSLSSVELFDPETNTFSFLQNMNKSHFAHDSVLLSNGYVLIGAGLKKIDSGKKNESGFIYDVMNGMELYNPETNSFVWLGVNISNPGNPINPISLKNEQVLFNYHHEKHYTGSGFLIFDSTNRKYIDTNQYITLNILYELTKFENRFILFSGGMAFRKYGKIQSKLDVFDTETQKVLDAGNMLTPRYAHKTTLLQDGRILITGGSTEIGFLTDAEEVDALEYSGLSSAEIYTP